MEKSVVFKNAYATFGDEESFQIMYLHKGFAIVAMSEEDISFMPLNQTEKLEILLRPGNMMEELDPTEDGEVLRLLDGIIGDQNAEEERAKLDEQHLQ